MNIGQASAASGVLEPAAMRDTLRALAESCHDGQHPECPILHELEGGDVPRAARQGTRQCPA
jgi:hypothetical protein